MVQNGPDVEDYRETLAAWRALVDVRFKLLALVPTISGIGVALLGRRADYSSALVAGGALVALFGIVTYELRNSVLHDAAVHRAKQLEIRLRLPKLSDKGSGEGGLLNERPRERYRLFGVMVWHDRGLFLVYSASAGGWVAVLFLGILGQQNLSTALLYAWAALSGIAAFFLVLWELHRFSRAVVQPDTADSSV